MTPLAWIPLLALLLGCGHYGPPLRADEAGQAAAAPAEECNDPDHERADGSHVPHEKKQP